MRLNTHLLCAGLFFLSAHAAQPHQQPMDPTTNAPGIQLPAAPANDNTPSGDVILSDVLGSHRQINLFAGLLRDIATTSERLDDASLNTTVLAPLNSAITHLPRKPWEDPRDYSALGASAYEGPAGEDRASRNLRRFVEAHVLPESPWEEGKRVRSFGGGELWWEKGNDGGKVIMPGSVEVEAVASTCANGEVWVLKAVLNYA